MSNHHTSEDGSSFTETSVTDAPQSGQASIEGDATPRPWRVDEVRTQVGRAFRIGSGEMLTAGKGCCIIYDDYGHGANERKANAALIVRAVNRDHHFEALVKALEMGVQVWSQVLANRYNEAPEDVREPVLNAMRAVLTAALSLSEPKS
jgi:hypothetical protein